MIVPRSCISWFEKVIDMGPLESHGLRAPLSYGLKLGRGRWTFPFAIMWLMPSWVNFLGSWSALCFSASSFSISERWPIIFLRTLACASTHSSILCMKTFSLAVYSSLLGLPFFIHYFIIFSWNSPLARVHCSLPLKVYEILIILGLGIQQRDPRLGKFILALKDVGC